MYINHTSERLAKNAGPAVDFPKVVVTGQFMLQGESQWHTLARHHLGLMMYYLQLLI